jgi:3-oxoacyl-[acyl-carrier-protein] synthase II
VDQDDRIVITGIGALTPLGSDARSAFRATVEGRSAVSALPFETHPEAQVRIGAALKGFQPELLLGKKEARRHGRFTQIVLAAAQEAVRDAELRSAGYAPERLGCILGVGMGGVDIIANEVLAYDRGGPRKLSPFGIPAAIPNIAAAMVAIHTGLRGPCFSISSACASSAHAIGEAMEMLRYGRVDAIITGGSESGLTPQGLAAFERLGALSKRNGEPARASRPFDRDRDGFVMSEGAAIIVLEKLARARCRGARIYAELCGYGTSVDAFHVTLPDERGTGMAQAMSSALNAARINPEDVDYINAHGTSTVMNDLAETRAIKRVFGHHAADVWISSTKSMLGHMLGSAAAFETIVAALAIEKGIVPPTLNLDTPADECDLDYVPHIAREKRVRVALNNSFGFGGHNAALVLRSV